MAAAAVDDDDDDDFGTELLLEIEWTSMTAEAPLNDIVHGRTSTAGGSRTSTAMVMLFCHRVELKN